MNGRTVSYGIAAACLSSTLGARAQGPGSASANAPTWTANGASACEKCLAPDVVAAILLRPGGHAERVDAHSCHTGSIYIGLKAANVDVFRQEVPRIAFAHPMAGVGDAAFWNPAGAVSAVKAPNRGCDISVVGAPDVTKIRDEALGRKLGEICNKLFALP
jgi:hypothetical protein